MVIFWNKKHSQQTVVVLQPRLFCVSFDILSRCQPSCYQAGGAAIKAVTFCHSCIQHTARLTCCDHHSNRKEQLQHVVVFHIPLPSLSISFILIQLKSLFPYLFLHPIRYFKSVYQITVQSESKLIIHLAVNGQDG